MTRATLTRRLRRIAAGEDGFSLLETVIAVTMIFGLLLPLTLTSLTGVRYIAFARERQGASQIADQLMEQARGLTFSKIKQGLDSGGLASDPNLVTGCAGDPVGTYRYKSCSGEKVVSSTGLASVAPLVPNNGTISSGFPLSYSWRTYVTNNDPSANPYRVTVVVSWTSGAVAGPATSVQTQSLFSSPASSIGSSTQAFSGPMPAFFFGQAFLPRGHVDLSGTVTGTTFQTGSLLPPDLESDVQQGQISLIQGSVLQSGESLTDGAGTQSGGATTASITSADNDPSSSIPTYSSVTLTSGVAGTLTSTGGGNTVTITHGSGDTGASASATAASATQVCPPSPATGETDLLPCGGGRVQQVGAMNAQATLNGTTPALGLATLARVSAPGSGSTALANRQAATGQDGTIQQTVTRYTGALKVGGLPANLTAPAGWTGFFFSLTGYNDTVVATTGSSASAPTATINGGTISYWNGTGYTTINLATTPGYSLSGWSQSVSGSLGSPPKTVTATLSNSSTATCPTGTSATPVTMSSQPATTATPSGAGSIQRTSAQATVGSPVSGTFCYLVKIQNSVVVNLAISVDLGTSTAKATYKPAPTGG